MIIEEITSQDFLTGLTKSRTVLVPVGATEGHGAHLPLGTDSFQALDACKKLSERRDVFVAPPILYGVWGDPTKASSEKGLQIEAIVES